MTFEDFLNRPPFSMDREEKERALTGRLTELTKLHREKCPEYARMLEAAGFDPDSVLQAAENITAFSHIRVLGLMTSAPLTENPETNRVYFHSLNVLAQELAAKKLLSINDPDFRCPVLSMGMTGDFEVAVEEGATMVRVGTAIFGKRDDKNGGTRT